jgi:DNA-binding transcriptional ArsR family regulator
MSAFCNQMKKLGKGIGNTARYNMLEALMKGPKTVSELVGIVKLSQPAVSQHLKTLKICNLVTDRKQGQEVYYTVNSEYMLGMLTALTANLMKQGHRLK